MSRIFAGDSEAIGIVEDISQEGLCLSKIPASFADTIQTCFALVNNPRQDVYMACKACWKQSTDNGMYRMIGFQIQEPPDSWVRFIENIEDDACKQDPYAAMVIRNSEN